MILRPATVSAALFLCSVPLALLAQAAPDWRTPTEISGYRTTPDYAETVAYLVARRTGLSPRSESYLDTYKGAYDQLDLHRIMRVANAIERLLDLPFRESRVFA